MMQQSNKDHGLDEEPDEILDIIRDEGTCFSVEDLSEQFDRIWGDTVNDVEEVKRDLELLTVDPPLIVEVEQHGSPPQDHTHQG